jgi:hypothetical protein
VVSSHAGLGQGTQDLVVGFGGQPSQPGHVGRLGRWKARCGGRFAGLVDEAVEAGPWGADQQQPGGRLALDAKAVGDLPGPEGVVAGAEGPALLADDDGDLAVQDVEGLVLGAVDVPGRLGGRRTVTRCSASLTATSASGWR